MNRHLLAAVAAVAIIAPAANAQDMSAPAYPETRTGDVVESIFGEEVADPYR